MNEMEEQVKFRRKLLTANDREDLFDVLAASRQEMESNRVYLNIFDQELRNAEQHSTPEVGIYTVRLPLAAATAGFTAKQLNREQGMKSITITERDLGSLRELLEVARRVVVRNRDHLLAFEEQLKHAQIVSQDRVPADVITIHTQARIHELDSGRKAVYTLVFPHDADVAKNRISVLAPFGSALLGYRVGDIVACVSSSAAKRLKIKEIVYQPEAAQRLDVERISSFSQACDGAA